MNHLVWPPGEITGMDVNSSIAENFSLTRGGPFYRLTTLFGRSESERYQVVKRALLGVSLGWLPLLVLACLQGLAVGTRVKIPFLLDYAANVRFLIALPILILAESAIDERWRTIVLEFLRSGLVDRNNIAPYEAIIGKVTRLRDRALPELAMLGLAYLAPLLLGKTDLLMSGITNWHALRAGELSMAGWWFRVVSAPIFRFLLLRWLWRMFLWTLFIWRVSRIRLYLVATHTDLAAGLGFLSEGQKAYSPIVFAGGTVIAGSVLNAIRYEGQRLSSLQIPMIAYGMLAIIVLVVPLLVVTPALLKTKRKALRDYGGLVTKHNQLFEAKWIDDDGPERQSILGNQDPSSLASLGNSFTVVRQMGIVPIDKPTLVTLALAAALPMILVLLFVTPANEVVHAVLKMLG
jgi:hypothetical protein